MTLQEAYECLELPQDSDLQKVRSKYDEQLSHFRMCIDNAPTMRLRDIYEKRLSQLEEAFKLLNGSDPLDENDLFPQLPHDRKQRDKVSEQVKWNQDESTGKPNQSKLLEMLQLTASSDPQEIKKIYQLHRLELLQLTAARVSTIATTAQKEVKELEKAFLLFFPQATEKEIYPEKAAAAETFTTVQPEKSNKSMVMVANIVVIGLFVASIIYVIKFSGNPSNVEELQSEVAIEATEETSYGKLELMTEDGYKMDYEGNIKSGLPHGYGYATYYGQNNETDTYTGNFIEGQRNGEGTYIWADGNQYEGYWENNMKHGLGTITWTDGERYEGEFVNDNRHGTGTMVYTDGTSEKSEWQDDRKIE